MENGPWGFMNDIQKDFVQDFTCFIYKIMEYIFLNINYKTQGLLKKNLTFYIVTIIA